MTAHAALLQSLDVPGYGLELIERVRRRTGGRIRLRMGSVYPALKALEARGLVRGRPTGRRTKGRPRRYYELTVRGVSAAAAQRAVLFGLLGDRSRGPALDVDAGAMIERLQRGSRLSAAALELQHRLQNVTRRRR